MVGVKYCGMDCRRDAESVQVTCKWCGKTSRRPKSLAQHKDLFCAKECYDKYQRRNMVSYVCETCSERFTVTASLVEQKRGKGSRVRFCSNKCAAKAMSGQNHPMFKGGSSISSNDGSCLVLFPEKVKSGRYVRTHRLVAEEIIGRQLYNDEHMIHLDGNKRNNLPGNLYVCSSISECQLILNGKIPFPEGSNLQTLANRAVPRETENEREMA